MFSFGSGQKSQAAGSATKASPDKTPAAQQPSVVEKPPIDKTPVKEESKKGAVPQIKIPAKPKSEKKTFGLRINSVDDAPLRGIDTLKRMPLTARNMPLEELSELQKGILTKRELYRRGRAKRDGKRQTRRNSLMLGIGSLRNINFDRMEKYQN